MVVVSIEFIIKREYTIIYNREFAVYNLRLQYTFYNDGKTAHALMKIILKCSR